MNLKTAAFLALFGMLLLTILLTVDVVNTLLALDLIPIVDLVRSLLYLFVSLGVTAFFYAFHKTQR